LKGKEVDLNEMSQDVGGNLMVLARQSLLILPVVEAARYPPREYYVLTDAGKPVFTRYLMIFPSLVCNMAEHFYYSRSDSEDMDNIASTVGVMQALISVFLADNDKLRCINAGKTRITFLLRTPLYYVCVSSWGEPESVVSYLLPIHWYADFHQLNGFCEGRHGLI